MKKLWWLWMLIGAALGILGCWAYRKLAVNINDKRASARSATAERGANFTNAK